MSKFLFSWKDTPSKADAISGVISIIIVILVWVGFSFFQAQSFNNLTNKNVSTWQAMFLNLKVEQKVK
jgi:hypothetical protein